MDHENQSSNRFIKLFGSATLVGCIAILTLSWSIYSSRSNDLAMERQLANQMTQIAQQDIQIAKQDVQITLSAEENQLLFELGTVMAKEASIDEQLRTPLPTDNADFAPTATALAIQSIQIEATRQAIENKQLQIEATQTSVAQPQATIAQLHSFTVSDANQVVLNENCNYWTPDITLYSDGTGDNNSSIHWDLTDLPAGIIVGDAIMAEIDGQLLGNNGVTFMITLTSPQDRRDLHLRDGAFFIVSPEDADGFLRLRVRNLECRGRVRETIYYP